MSPFVINFILENILAVGSWSPENVKAELFDFETGTWTITADYPFASGSYVAYYDMVYIPQASAYYVIGGHDGSNLNTIAKFKNGAWNEAGQFNTAREVSFFFCFKITDSILSRIELNGQMAL